MYFGGHSRHRCLRFVAPVVVVLALTWAGCSIFRVPEEPAMPTPIDPVWSADDLEDHIDFLNSDEAAERTTGTQGFAQAAAYVGARMREFNLQPAYEGEFRVVYSTPINYPISAALRTVAGSDSVLFYPGIDTLPDGRSDSGRAAVRTIVVTDDTTGLASAPSGPFGVLLRNGAPRTETLQRWKNAGAVLAVAIQPLQPRYFGSRVPGLVAIQLTPRALRRLVPRNAASAAYGDVVTLERRIVAQVHAAFEAGAGAMNIMGYIAGKHPEHGRDLVIVCTDLDAVSDFAGVRTLDFENFGVETAALLEVARNLSFVSRRWQLPERSVMLAVWSGSQLGHQGLRNFLEDPAWSLRRISSVIYIGLDDAAADEVRQMLNGYGIPLDVIAAPAEPLFEHPYVLIPDPAVERRARSGRGEAPLDRVDPDLGAVVDSAVVQAAQLAAATYERMLIATTDPRPFYPVREDTLAVPRAAGDASP